MRWVTVQRVAILLILAIILGSIIPIPEALEKDTIHPFSFHLLHFIVYAVAGFLWARSLKSRRRYLTWMVVSIPLTEIVQLLLPYREACVEDLLMNLAGTIVGYSMYIFLK